MRISDWSSDVCSSDRIPLLAPGCRIEDDMRGELQRLLQRHDLLRRPVARHRKVHKLEAPGCQLGKAPTDPRLHHRLESLALLDPPAHDRRVARSEEHTSELQSLMRISYAVFC